MQRFLKWLGMKLFPQSQKPTLRQTGILPKPKKSNRPGPLGQPRCDLPFQANSVEFDAEVQGRVEDGGPGKNVLIRNKYLREDTGTHESLKILDDSMIDSGEESGFDPYNTGRFDRSRNWNTRTGK